MNSLVGMERVIEEKGDWISRGASEARWRSTRWDLCGQACNWREGKSLNLDQYLSLQQEERAKHLHAERREEEPSPLTGSKSIRRRESRGGGGDVAANAGHMCTCDVGPSELWHRWEEDGEKEDAKVGERQWQREGEGERERERERGDQHVEIQPWRQSHQRSRELWECKLNYTGRDSQVWTCRKHCTWGSVCVCVCVSLWCKQVHTEIKRWRAEVGKKERKKEREKERNKQTNKQTNKQRTFT